MKRTWVATIVLAMTVTASSATRADVAGDIACREAKARAAGKQAADILKAYARNEKKPNDVKMATDLSRSGLRFRRALGRAEAKGYCAALGDGKAIGDAVDAFVSDVWGVISPVCGDGRVAPGEECDGDDDAACPGLCRADCTCLPCGDGRVAPGEECDGDDDAACPGLCRGDCTCMPCAGSSWSTCGGICPPTQTCGDIGFGCGCIATSSTSCGSSYPACDGGCPAGHSCAVNGYFGCTCVPTEYTACGDAEAPLCDGACRRGLFCVENDGTCGCLPGGGGRPCGTVEGAPTCLGGCPSEAPICRDQGGSCTCTAWPSRAFLDLGDSRLD